MKEIAHGVRVECSLQGSFFKYWLDFLQPLHGLQEREKTVLAHLLKKRYELSQVILDENILKSNLMSNEVKREIKELYDFKSNNLQVVFTKLKDKKAIVNGDINPKLIPAIGAKPEQYKLMIAFNFQKDEE